MHLHPFGRSFLPRPAARTDVVITDERGEEMSVRFLRTVRSDGSRGWRLRCLSVLVAGALGVFAGVTPASGIATAAPAAAPSTGQPAFGPNVYVFSPGMPQSQIQATVDAVASQQVSNQFGSQRYALLFEPGTY